MGRSLDDHRPGGFLYQPHPDAGSARDLAAAPVRGIAAAPPGNHLRDQPPLPGGNARALPRRQRPGRAYLADRRERRAPRAHGRAGGAGLPPRQRRVRAALAADDRDHLRRLLPAVSGTFRQRHQRRHPAALADAGQPRAVDADRRTHRHRLAPRSGAAVAAAHTRRRRRIRARPAARETREQAAPGRARRLRAGPDACSGHPVRRSGPAQPRVQAPTAQPAARGRALPGHRPGSGRAGAAAHGAAGRQGGLGLPLGQADHPARARPGAGGEFRSALRRQAAAGVPAQLRRQRGGSADSRRRPQRADLHRRHRGLRHRQHEVRAQRCAHHRHLGWRQYRDGGSNRRGRAVRVRPARRGRARGARARL